MDERHRVIVDWLYTRHHDGRVRESALRRAMPARELWMVPFAVQLIGEYVIEILMSVDELLTDANAELFGNFVSENPEFLRLTRSRAVSYWNCYYRDRFPHQEEYVGERVLRRLEGWGISSRGIG
jgi:hypothetical protein